ncbi:hypothetical protein CPC08DRAFT_824611 [Agrocybe pediades]|nr:hypothetical protein CPC08DRAFT_824611 [Agrocybe pediades]
MADEDGGFPKDVGRPQAFPSSTSMKRDLFAEDRPLKKRQAVVQTFVDNTLRTAQIMLDNANRHLQEYQDTFSVAEDGFSKNDVLLLQNFTLMPPLLPLNLTPQNFLRLSVIHLLPSIRLRLTDSIESSVNLTYTTLLTDTYTSATATLPSDSSNSNEMPLDMTQGLTAVSSKSRIQLRLQCTVSKR